MNQAGTGQRSILCEIARRSMLEKGLLPDYSPEVMAEISAIQTPGVSYGEVRDLTEMPWASIDNDDTRDIDQVTAAQQLSGASVKIFVAVADVESLVKRASAIDDHARLNATSVYTAAQIFPMLPERLSTDLTSLNFREERSAVVCEMEISQGGAQLATDVYKARVNNRAKLAYESVAMWLDGKGSAPPALSQVKGLEENLRLQDRTAQAMNVFRRSRGALGFETVEARPVFDGKEIIDIEVEKRNRARTLIEEFMIGANVAAAGYLAGRGFPFLSRVVHTPKRWERIVELAKEHGFSLPPVPDARRLELFLAREKAANPGTFPDLSFAVIKLIGSGEYTAEPAGDHEAPEHFSLGTGAYAHATAPNRRYSDLVTQRLLKAAIEGRHAPYSVEELEKLAVSCTEKENAALKVERQVFKSAAAILLQTRIGEEFDAIVTGAAAKGTWVRLSHPPVEGKLVEGFQGVDVGHRVRVKLINTEAESGFIDFRKV